MVAGSFILFSHKFFLFYFQLGADMFSDIYFPLLSYKPRARSLPGHYRNTKHRSRRTPLSMYSSPQSSKHFYPIHSYHSTSQSSLNSSYRQQIETSAFLYASSIRNNNNNDKRDFDAFINDENAGIMLNNSYRTNTQLFDKDFNKENFDCLSNYDNNNKYGCDAEHIYYDPEFDNNSQAFRTPCNLNCYTIQEENYGSI